MPVAATLVITALGLASCVDQGHPRVAFASPALGLGDLVHAPLANDGRVILVTLDGVRAEDVFDGADASLKPHVNVAQYARPASVMPRTHKLVATRGVALGADRRVAETVRTASGANVSLPGYLEIFTGRKTECRDNGCAPTERPTVLDEAAEAGLSVASIGSWNVLDHAVSRGNTGVFVETGSHRWPGPRPLADAKLEALVVVGERTEPFPGGGWYRPDARTIPIALHYFAETKPAVFHVGLGDSDEYGHRDDYASYLAAIGKADAFIGQLSDLLDGMGEEGAKTTVIVTTDHGRNSDFRPSRLVERIVGAHVRPGVRGARAGARRGVLAARRDAGGYCADDSRADGVAAGSGEGSGARDPGDCGERGDREAVGEREREGERGRGRGREGERAGARESASGSSWTCT